MSYLEFFGTVAGGIAVWLSARGNIWSWPIGIINVSLYFFLFFQVQLYPDMFLQSLFFVTNLMGWPLPTAAAKPRCSMVATLGTEKLHLNSWREAKLPASRIGDRRRVLLRGAEAPGLIAGTDRDLRSGEDAGPGVSLTKECPMHPAGWPSGS